MTQPADLESDDFEAAARRSKAGASSGTLVALVLGGLALLSLLGVRVLLFQPFSIPSGSLVPSLLIGDYVLVSKYAYGYSRFSLPFPDWASGAGPGRVFGAEPKRGDVVVFKLPRDGATDYIKRVIGLPGDKIQMINGRLYINGTIVERAALPPYSMTIYNGHPVAAAHYEETLPGGVKHEIIQLDGDGGPLANTPVYQVPPGDFFTMGDNRDNSLDSRVPPEQDGVGYVPFENLVGRAEMIFFSVDAGEPTQNRSGWPWTVRWGRLFQAVR